jgi:preprotein translocase SecF subunit
MVSAVVILIGMVSLTIKGIDWGIDFLGGTELVVQFNEAPGIGNVRTAMDKIGFAQTEIKSFGSDRDILIRTREQGEGTTVGDRIRAGLKDQFPNNTYIVLKEDKIGPKIGAELRRNAVYAVVASLVAIWLYIGFRFKFVYGLGAVAALFHDVLVTLGLVSIFDGIFNLEISQNMIAAFLTLIGLSVNDTVVIFDRIREKRTELQSLPLAEQADIAVSVTLTRSLYTSFTTLLPLVALILFGGSTLLWFAVALSIGILVGSWSSVAIAPTLLPLLTRR